MIGEAQVRRRLYARHMAAGARSRDRRLVYGRGVASFARGVVGGEVPLQRRVRRVAGEASQFPAAETRAGGEHQGLVADIPRIAEIRCFIRAERHPMAAATKVVEPHRVRAFPDYSVDVPPVTARAPRRARGKSSQRTPSSCGTIESSAARVSGPVEWQEKQFRMRAEGSKIRYIVPRGVAAPGVGPKPLILAIPGLAHFAVMFGACARYKCDGLVARAEGPIARLGTRRNARAHVRASWPIAT